MIEVNESRVRSFAWFFRDSRHARPFDFCSLNEGVVFPARGQPGVIDLFFFLTAHQFGFWVLNGNFYDRPMTARIDGVEHKGSDFLFRCATRALARHHDFFSPPSVAAVSDEEWGKVFADDHGRNPLPMWEEHLALIYGYARWFAENPSSPPQIVHACNQSPAPLATFLEELADLPGYAEDPLRKKLMLLAVILENRPEHFLHVTDPESYEPIIDYHLQRSALRTGLVRVDDPALREKLIRREVVTPAEEEAIRAATFKAVRLIVELTGLSVAAIDYFFFTNRKRCPEMSVPECAVCPVKSICARETKLFQPVLRTTYY